VRLSAIDSKLIKMSDLIAALVCFVPSDRVSDAKCAVARVFFEIFRNFKILIEKKFFKFLEVAVHCGGVPELSITSNFCSKNIFTFCERLLSKWYLDDVLNGVIKEAKADLDVRDGT